MTDKIPVRYLPTEEAQPALGEYRTDDTVPVIHGGTGATTPEDARINLGIVSAPGSVTEFPYILSLPPTATPTAGQVSRNNADPTLVTALYYHKLDNDGVDQTTFLSAVKSGDWVNLNLASDPNSYEQYDATGPATVNGDVYTVPVVYFGQAGTALQDTDLVDAYWRIASGIEEAPIDGTPYERQDAGWVAAAGQPVAPTDGVNKLGIDGGWTNAGDAAAKNTGTGAGDVAAGDHNHDATYDALGAAAAVQSDLDAHKLVAVISSDNTVDDAIALTQAEYDLLTPDATTLYLITD